jgi:hypothetical protein
MLEDTIELHVNGATEAEIIRGVSAALAVFTRAGATPLEAAGARFKEEGEQELLTEREAAIAHVWAEAEDVAISTCCQGWREIPRGAHIRLPVDWDAQPPPDKRKIFWWLIEGLEDTLVNIELGNDERFTLHLVNEPVAGPEEAEAVARRLARLYDVPPSRVVEWR